MGANRPVCASNARSSACAMSYTQPWMRRAPLASAAATAGKVRKCSSWPTTFSSVTRRRASSPSSLGLFSATTYLATSACLSHAATEGMCATLAGASKPFIAPQSEWPQMTMCFTCSTFTAYSMAATTPLTCCA